MLVVERIDITPPGKPTLARVNATPAGIALSWEYSADDDVVRHELQRRLQGGPNWETVVTIDAAAEDNFVIDNFDAAGSINYLDKTDLPRNDYEYQLLAFDEMNLGAGSEIVAVRPHDSGERGEIQDLAVSAGCADSVVVTDLDEAYQVAIMKAKAMIRALGPLKAMPERLGSIYARMESALGRSSKARAYLTEWGMANTLGRVQVEALLHLSVVR